MGTPPPASPEGTGRFLTVCRCSLLKENHAAPTFVRRELDRHLAANGARLCKHEEARCSLFVSRGCGPEVGTPGVSETPLLHKCLQPPMLSWLGTHPGDVCLGGRGASGLGMWPRAGPLCRSLGLRRRCWGELCLDPQVACLPCSQASATPCSLPIGPSMFTFSIISLE